MARSTGIVLAAGGLAAANEVFFAPVAAAPTNAMGTFTVPAAAINNFNWRLIPATAILAVALAGFEKVAPDFAVGLAGLVLLAVLIIPVGHAPTPVQNIAKFIGA